MPTIQQLPAASTANATDELPVSQNGITRSVSVGDLLASTQPAITVASNALLGRVSLGPGGPEPVALGLGLGLASGSLSATGGDHASFAVQSALTLTDQVVLNSSGVPARMSLPLLRGLFAAGHNVAIDANGTLSAATDASVTASLSTLGTQTAQALAAASSSSTLAGNVVNAQGQVVAPVVGDVSAATLLVGGGVARSTAMRAADVVNVRDYGADASGGADCTAAFNAAYSAALAASAAIYVPRGTYLLNSALSWSQSQPITLFGDGRFASVLVPTHTGVALSLTQSDPSYGVDVRNLGFRAGGARATACALAVSYTNNRGNGHSTPFQTTHIEGISIRSATSTTSGSYGNTFTGGMQLTGLMQATIRGVDWTNPTAALAGTYCIQFGQCYNTVFDSIWGQNGAVGLNMVDYCAGLRFGQCTWSGTLVGFRNDAVPAASQVGGANAAEIHIVGGEWDCVTSSVIAASVAELWLRGASFSAAGQSGASLTLASVTGGSSLIVAACKFLGNGGGQGLAVTGTAGGTVAGNVFANLATGFALGSGATGLVASGNQGDDSDGVAASFSDGSGNTTNHLLWQKHGGVVLTNANALSFSNPAGGSSFAVQSDGTAPLLLTGQGKGVVIGNATEPARLAYGAAWLQSFTYATLPAVSANPLSICWCSNARIGGQVAGAGTGAPVMASGGSWWMLSGAAVLV